MSDRLISAEKAKEVLKHLLYETAMNNELDIADIYEDIAEKRLNTWIELIPTADAVKHGHWIERSKVYPDFPYDSTYNFECSNCGYGDTHGADGEVPYCWHCGAKMDETCN